MATAYHDGPALRGRCSICGAQATHNEGATDLRCDDCCSHAWRQPPVRERKRFTRHGWIRQLRHYPGAE